MKWCNGIHPKGATHDQEHVQGLAVMRRPEAVGEVFQFYQSANWMMFHPLYMKGSLQALMNERLAET